MIRDQTMAPGLDLLRRSLNDPVGRVGVLDHLVALSDDNPTAWNLLADHVADTRTSDRERLDAFWAIAAASPWYVWPRPERVDPSGPAPGPPDPYPGQLPTEDLPYMGRSPFPVAAVLDSLARRGDGRLAGIFALWSRSPDPLMRHRARAWGASHQTPEGQDPDEARHLVAWLHGSDRTLARSSEDRLVAMGPAASQVLLAELGQAKGAPAKALELLELIALTGDRATASELVGFLMELLSGEEDWRSDPAGIYLVENTLWAIASLWSRGNGDDRIFEAHRMVTERPVPASVYVALVRAVTRVPGPRSTAVVLGLVEAPPVRKVEPPSPGDPDDPAGPGPWWKVVVDAALDGLTDAVPSPASYLVPTLARLLRSRGRDWLGARHLLLAIADAYRPGRPLPRDMGELLAKRMASRHGSVRRAALVATDALTAPTGSEPPPVPPEVVDGLVARLADESVDLARRALQLVADIAPPFHVGCWRAASRLVSHRDPGVARAAVRLLARVGDLRSGDLLVELATGDRRDLASTASSVLDHLTGPVVIRWNPEDGYRAECILGCRCGGTPVRRSSGGRELLVCPDCGARYVLTRGGYLEPEDELPHGTCRCCSIPAPLEVDSQGRLVCPYTLDVHVKDPASGRIVLVDSLELGTCSCCEPAVPLVRAPSGEVVCPVTGRLHPADQEPRRVTRRPMEQPRGDEPRAVEAPQGPRIPSIDEINRALLEGTLFLGQSGIPLPPPEER